VSAANDQARDPALPVSSAAGEVDSARLRTSSSDIRTSMMRSAAPRAWRLDPAMRNGRPVGYRYLARLTYG
jgi:hypothetical protein